MALSTTRENRVLKNLFGTKAKTIRSRKPTCTRPRLEALEARDLPTAFVFVDFGDNFPGNVLTTTVGAVRDVATAQLDNGGNPIPNTVVQGPRLTNANNPPRPGTSDPSNLYADTTAVSFTQFNFTADQRAQMMAIARRAFAGLDVTVVELTTSGQMLSDGRFVAGTSTMAGVSQVLRNNNTNTRDVYIIAATPAIGASNDNPNNFATNAYGGIAPGGNVLGEDTDLRSSLNNHDDLALAFVTSGNVNFTANTIVHEAGHALGLQHAVTTAAPGDLVINTVLHSSEVMSYLSDGDIFFSRFPMVRGDDNTDGASPPLNNNDLAARQGQRTPFDQLRVDPNVGENPNLHYISGTGAFDIITITRGADNTANVSVEAFTNDSYNAFILVPGTNLSTYTYTVNLDRPLLIQAGLGDDRIIIDGALSAQVSVDGMGGNDELIINDQATFATFAMDYNVTAGQVTRERIDFIGIGFQSTWLTVSHTAVDAVTLNAGASVTRNVITVGEAVAAVDGQLTIRGGTGLDLLTINDQASFGLLGTTYTVNDAQVARERRDVLGSTWLTVGYVGVEALTLDAGTSASPATININSLPAAPVAVNLSSPVNLVTVGQEAGSVNGQLTINGGGAFDVLTINDQAFLPSVTTTYTVTSSEVDRVRLDLFGSAFGLTVGHAGIEDLTLNTGAGASVASINVNGLPAAPMTLKLGGPLNIVSVGQEASSVDGQLTVNGGAGVDVLIISDQALFPATPATYTVTSTEVARERFVTAGLFWSRLTVDYAGVEDLTLNAGGSIAGNAVNVNSLPAAAVTVNLSSPVNIVTVGQEASSVNGQLTVNGSGGFDALTINDQATLLTLTMTYTVTSDEVARRSVHPTGLHFDLSVGYAGIEVFTLNTGGSASGAIVNVNSLPAVPMTVNLGSFLNVFTVGQAGASVDGQLTVNGGGVFDVLTINDQALLSPLRSTYTVTSTEVARERRDILGVVYGLTVGYAGIEGLTLNAGAAQDSIGVLGTAPGTPVTISPGLGDDTVNVGGPDNRLDGIQGALTILDGTDGTLPAGFDHNVITLHDEGNATAGYDYTMSDTALTRAGIAPINLGPSHYDQIDVHPAGGDTHVTFAGAPGYYTWTYWYAGAGNDRVDVLATPFGAFLVIFDDGGNDVFRVGSASQGPDDVAPHGGIVENIGDGQVYFSDYGGTARVVLDNSGGTTPQTVTVFPNGAFGLNDHNVQFYYTGTPATIYGGSGGNTFSLQQYGGVGTPLEIYAGSGNDTLNFDQPHTYPYWYHTFGFHGQGGTDTLNINDQTATDAPTWDISPSAIIRIARLELYGWDKVVTMPISGLENVNINGGSGNDTFQIKGTAFAPGIRIDGGLGVNQLDYSAVTQGTVVNLPLGTATGLTGGIANIRNVIGGAGNDVLVGDVAANSLWGGAGRDLLIGGLGADLLDGGADDDILIGGYTAYDSNPTALDAVMREWMRTDLDVLGPQESYKARIDHLMSGGGLNGAYVLKSSKGQGTVLDDGLADMLTGGDGLDWFFGDKKQDIIAKVPPEKVS
jgi:hypothetical protein